MPMKSHPAWRREQDYALFTFHAHILRKPAVAFSRSADNNVRRQCDDAVHCAGPYVVSAACVMPPPMTD